MTNKEQVLKLHNKGYSVNQISKFTGLTNKQIHSIYSKVKGLFVNRYDLIQPKDDLIQLIIGSLLGDGSFTKSYKKNQSAKLSIAHTLKQKELISYKHNILRKYNLEGKICKNRIKSDRYKKGYMDELRFKSKSHPIFYYVRNNYYRNNEKGVFKEYLNFINPLGIAIWYMDDGNVTNHSFQFNTQSFTDQEKKLLQAKLRQYKIRTTLHKQGQIYILAESKDLFIDIVKPYILPSFKYKLVPYSYMES